MATNAKGEVTKLIKDSDSFEVVSCVPNVYYTCPKTLDSFIWADVGDVEILTFAQLKLMRNAHIGYFSKGILAIRDENAMTKLGLDKYLKPKFAKKDYRVICGHDFSDAKDKILCMSDADKEQYRENIVRDVKNGKISNVKIIRLLEKEFDLELLDLV